MAGTELFGEEEKKEVLDVLETGILFRYNHDEQRKGIWKARQFEEEFSDFLNIKHTHFCSSGTAADSLSLACCGIGAGDEVIVPPFTFIAPIEAVLMAGAIPVFADIDETLCLSPEGIEKAITPRTKAVMLIQVFGSMARMDEILDVCNKNNLILIEDAAPSLGGTYKGKALGSFGKVGAFSFDFFKPITAGEGGAVVTNDPDLYEKIHMYSDHGHDHIGDNRGAEQHPILGYNFRGSELHAAVALAQLRKLPHIIKKQREHQNALKNVLREFPEITLRNVPDEEGDSAAFLGFFTESQEKTLLVSDEFNKQGIGAAYWYNNSFHYHKQWGHLKSLSSIYKMPVSLNDNIRDYSKIDLPSTDKIMSRLLMFQILVNWDEDYIEDFSNKLRNSLKTALK
jgi:8-amino-3,8-dideoxy-alpha-D-manno-octulosonate transaminase